MKTKTPNSKHATRKPETLNNKTRPDCIIFAANSHRMETIVKKKTRIFLPYNLNIETWDDIKPYFDQLKKRNVQDWVDFEKWLCDLSEMEAVLEEEAAWRYIKMTCDTANDELRNRYSYFVTEISPKIAPLANEFNKRIHLSPFKERLPEHEQYRNYFKSIAKDIEIYREANIPLEAELANQAQEYGAMQGAMTIEHDGKQLTLQQAAVFLKNNDRALREKIWRAIAERRFADKDKLDTLLSDLIAKRHQMAVNADFENFRDYKFKALGRFDYTQEDCFNFHESIRQFISPIIAEQAEERKQLMGLDKLRPWDGDCDALGREPLHPFEGGAELLAKTKTVFNNIDPYFKECLDIMENMGHLDLESRIGKSPGGYNYPLYEVGVPFIFMNAAGTQSDLVTMVHEGGHAVHSFLTKNLKLTSFKSFPSEVAELASMSMELITMEQWNQFYPDSEQLNRAKIDQLERALSVLPWVAIVDKFQHWLYEKPKHTLEERKENWLRINQEIQPSVTDWSGLEQYRAYNWQRQLHIYEVPFYYIEYGLAQLGAIAIWKNYKENPEKALSRYKWALSLGYTKTIPEIYKAAGIRFDFSPKYIQSLAAFVKEELVKLKS